MIDPLIEALRSAGPENVPVTKLATVTSRNGTGVLVRFDGESTASSRRYKALQGVEVNDRVLMLRVGSAWIVAAALESGLTPAMHAGHYAEAIGNNVWFTLINWIERFGHPDIVWNGTSTWTIQRTGFYHIDFQAMFRNEVSSAGVRAVAITHNGNFISGSYSAPIVGQADYVNAKTSCTFDCPAGTTLQFRALQNSGGTVTVHDAPYTQVSIHRVR